MVRVKDVKLSTGRVVKIRRVPGIALFEMASFVRDETSAQQHAADIVKVLWKYTVVSKDIQLEDLDITELTELLDAIMDFSGLSESVQTKFR